MLTKGCGVSEVGAIAGARKHKVVEGGRETGGERAGWLQQVAQ